MIMTQTAMVVLAIVNINTIFVTKLTLKHAISKQILQINEGIHPHTKTKQKKNKNEKLN